MDNDLEVFPELAESRIAAAHDFFVGASVSGLAGRQVEVPRAGCPSCGGPMTFWSGYQRYVRVGGRCRKIFVPRLRCGRCGASNALLPGAVTCSARNVPVGE